VETDLEWIIIDISLTSKNISYCHFVNCVIYNSHVRLLGSDGKLSLRPQLAPDSEVLVEYKEQIQQDTVKKRWTLWSVIFVPLKHFNMSTNFSKIPQKRSLVRIRPVEVALFQAGKQTDKEIDRQTDRQTDRQRDRRTDRQTERWTGRHVVANRLFSLPAYGKRCIVSTE
jgi:hypothetical protein